MNKFPLGFYSEIFRQLQGNLYVCGGDPLLRDALLDIFEVLGVKSVEFDLIKGNGILIQEPGVLLFDLTAPFMPGLDSLYKAQSRLPFARTLLISTASREELEQRSGRPLMAPLLQKPFSLEQLLNDLILVWRKPGFKSSPAIKGGVDLGMLSPSQMGLFE